MQAYMQLQCHVKEISCQHQQPNHSAGQLPNAPSQIGEVQPFSAIATVSGIVHNILSAAAGLRQAIRLSHICRAYTAAIDIPTAFTDPALRAAYEAGHKVLPAAALQGQDRAHTSSACTLPEAAAPGTAGWI